MKLTLKVFGLLQILIISIFSHLPIYACTGFMMSEGVTVLVGNNEDFKVPYTRVWFIPAENGRFGRIYFGYDNWYPQGGMNDQGLFFDYFSVPKLKIKQPSDKPQFPGPVTDTTMAKCATVKDVIELYSKYY
jgi:hypothetical protein